MTQQEILEKLRTAFADTEKAVSDFPEDRFFQRPVTGKWSAAENIQHLFLSAKPLVGLFANPEMILQQWGRSNRTSRSYDELLKIYNEKVGDVKVQPTVSNPISVCATKAEQLANLHAIHSKFIERASGLSELILDDYQIPHPVLGLLTVREFLYFTHFHTQHHYRTVVGLQG